MFTAITSEGSIICLYEMSQQAIHQLPRREYYCPECEQRLTLKRGSVKVAHFAHDVSCTNSAASQRETQNHLTGKSLIYSALRTHFHDVHLEFYIPTIVQRADVCLQSPIPMIFEFQCSKISAEQLQLRTAGYLSLGYQCRWILHADFLPKNLTDFSYVKLSKFLQAGIFTHMNGSKSITFLCVKTATLHQLILYEFYTGDYAVCERIELQGNSPLSYISQPKVIQPKPQKVLYLLKKNYEKMRREAFLFSFSKDKRFHFLITKWRKTEATFPTYIGLPCMLPHSLGPDIYWQFAYVNFLVTCREGTADDFLFSLSDHTLHTTRNLQLIETYSSFLKANHLPHRPFSKSSSKTCYISQWYSFQIVAKRSKD
ncbi:competence CoiA-like predicted nuclease [Chryseomicrobium aureum]|uniref:competence protein CoiA n=1 Tax=Chryseomicrobium aureum TaxID=1441723 RepID=UPI00195B6A5D|nr:competence protein CoiA family protein [Chryseomicrobium aureum]MBM7705224.1 competence CoiA-like predicted nuclease [Chryseomicrobium aureum]